MSRTKRNGRWRDGTGRHQSTMGHRQTKKWLVGVGGINCSCCTKLPFNEQKPQERRYDRHLSKQSLKKEVDSREEND